MCFLCDVIFSIIQVCGSTKTPVFCFTCLSGFKFNARGELKKLKYIKRKADGIKDSRGIRKAIHN